MIQVSLFPDGRLTVSIPDEWGITTEYRPDHPDGDWLQFTYRGQDRFHVELRKVFISGFGTIWFNEIGQITQEEYREPALG
jgi:hypothetical protein